MSKLKIINKLIYLENAMCVYRNYLFLSVKMKRFVKLRILLEIAVYLYMYYRFLNTSLRIFRSFDNINFYFLFTYNLFSITNTLIIIVFGVTKAKHFKEFVASIDSVYDLNKDDKLYQYSMKKLNKRFLYVSSLSLIVTTTLVSLYGSLIVENAANRILVDLLFDVIFQLRYFFSDFAFYVLIEVIVASMQYLNCSMEEALEKLKRGDGEDFVETGGVLAEICNKLKNLNQTSRDLASANESLKQFFGIQIAISVATDTLYYIILTYQGITLCIDKIPQYKIGSQSFLFLLVVYLLMKVLIVLAGQRVRNEASRLNTAFARLNCSLVPSGCARKLRRMTVHLCCELRVRPLRVLLLSPLLVQMPLLLEIFSIVLNYTIILLQFNHVI